MSTDSEPSVGSPSFVKDLSLTIRKGLSDAEWLEFSEQSSDSARISFLLQNSKLLPEVKNCIRKIMASGTKPPELEVSTTDFDKNLNGEDKSKDLKPQTSKDRTKALALKDAGNKVFGQGNNERALEFYSKALAWMPGDEKVSCADLAILYANRSAALYHLKEYYLAQTDIEFAFKLNYPSNLAYKLYERSARCFLEEGKKTSASSQVQKALKVISKLLSGNPPPSKDEENKLIKAKMGLETLLKTCSGIVSPSSETISLNGPQTASSVKVIPPVSGGCAKGMKNASNKLCVKYNEAEGRHVVATQAILPGEVILVEKAFVSAVTPECFHRHCQQCFNPLRAPIPCRSCSTVSFCSKFCRNEAWETHHRSECKILGILSQSGVSITCFLALRVLTRHSKGELSEVVKWFVEMAKKEPGIGPPAQDGNEYRADHISSLCQLVTHSDKREPEDFFQRTVMALFILSLLNLTDFIPTTPSPTLTGELRALELKNETKAGAIDVKDRGLNEEASEIQRRANIVVGTLLSFFLQVLQFNAHEVSGWSSDSEKSVFLGGGIFPTLAFFNHSCDPSIVRYFVNDTVVVRGVRTLLKGEPVTENYGPVFTEMEKSARQAQLYSQYWFVCACVPCTEDWPLFQNLVRDNLNFRCTFCRSMLCKSTSLSIGLLLQCARCGRPTNILKSLKSLQDSEPKYHQAMDLMKKGRPESAVGILEENITLFDSILMPPFRDYHWCQEGLRKCYLALGNETTSSQKSGEEEIDDMTVKMLRDYLPSHLHKI